VALNGRSVLGWLDRLDEATVGRLGLLPKPHSKPLSHPVRAAILGFIGLGGVAFLMRWFVLDDGLLGSVIWSVMFGLIPVWSVWIRQRYARRPAPLQR
jgi:hypothetical protein